MRASIQEMYENIKSLLRNDGVYFGLIIVLVGVSSFGLGRWSVLSEKVEVIEQVASEAAKSVPTSEPKRQSSTTASANIRAQEEVKASLQGERQYVASKSGTKYHLLWCPGAKSIKETNKIYFKSKVEAEKAGYKPASNCKGM